MKDIITICLILLGLTNAHSQLVNNIPIKDLDVEYITIVGSSKPFSNKLTIQLDYGQERNPMTTENTRINDTDGNPIEFNSIVDALNFLHANGYAFLNVYTTYRNERDVVYYLLRKTS